MPPSSGVRLRAFIAARPGAGLSASLPVETPQPAALFRMHVAVFAGLIILGAAVFSLIELTGALLLGQSPVLGLFGIAIVDRQNQPASRLRLLWRWTINWILFGTLGWVTAGFICVRFMMYSGLFPKVPPVSVLRYFTIASIILFSAAVLLSLVFLVHATLKPERSLADRLSGTRLAPK